MKMCVHFLDTVFVLVALAAVHLFLAMLKVLFRAFALGSLAALFSNLLCGLNDTPGEPTRHADGFVFNK